MRPRNKPGQRGDRIPGHDPRRTSAARRFTRPSGSTKTRTAWTRPAGWRRRAASRSVVGSSWTKGAWPRRRWNSGPSARPPPPRSGSTLPQYRYLKHIFADHSSREFSRCCYSRAAKVGWCHHKQKQQYFHEVLERRARIRVSLVVQGPRVARYKVIREFMSRKRTREVCLASRGANPAVAQRAQTHGGQEKGRQKTMNKLCCL